MLIPKLIESHATIDAKREEYIHWTLMNWLYAVFAPALLDLVDADAASRIRQLNSIRDADSYFRAVEVTDSLHEAREDETAFYGTLREHIFYTTLRSLGSLTAELMKQDGAVPISLEVRWLSVWKCIAAIKKRYDIDRQYAIIHDQALPSLYDSLITLMDRMLPEPSAY